MEVKGGLMRNYWDFFFFSCLLSHRIEKATWLEVGIQRNEIHLFGFVNKNMKTP